MYEIKNALGHTMYACTDPAKMRQQMVKYADVPGVSFELNGQPLRPRDVE